MILTAKKILEHCDYCIRYNYLGNYSAEIVVSWLDKRINLKWDNEGEILISNYFDEPIPIKRYAVNHLVLHVLKDVCVAFGYDIGLVHFSSLGVVTDQLFIIDPIEMDEDEGQKNKDIDDLCRDITTGFMPEHIDIAKEFSIWDGFKTIVEQSYRIKLNDLRDISSGQ
jgi:hypothetical protein